MSRNTAQRRTIGGLVPMLIAGSLPGFAGAQQPPTLAEICAGERVEFELPAFDAFDADGDGFIGDREAADCGALNELFERLDLDGNQVLTREEYGAFAELWERHARSLG